jgi:Uma2 family endonuclease
MTTLLKIGPADHGRPLTLEEFLSAEGQEGFHYEIIGGKLYVSPMPNPSENWAEEWLGDLLRFYVRAHPGVINYVSSKARVFVPGAAEVTAPEPDLAAYHDYPRHRAPRDLRWEEVSPLLVVEILVEGDPDKDLNRNVELYRQVASIQEYWILDAREDAMLPALLVYRRRDRRRWRKVLTIEPGGVYSTDLLPGFNLTLDAHPEDPS